jgi:hypothetical protein
LLTTGESITVVVAGMVSSVGRNKLAQFRQGSASMPELRKLVPAYVARVISA